MDGYPGALVEVMAGSFEMLRITPRILFRLWRSS
jgi:hypothetical protein